jgi:Polysaccharide lyase
MLSSLSEKEGAPPSPASPRHPRHSLLRLAVALVVVLGVVVGAGMIWRNTQESAPPLPSPAPGTTVLFADSFNGKRWCEYNRVQNRQYSDPACGYHDQSYLLRHDGGAARFEVRPGDDIGGGLGGGERSEISQDSASWQAHEGDEWIVQERLRLAKDFQPGARWTILTQFHAGVGGPPLSLQVDPQGALILNSAGDTRDANYNAGKPDRVLVPAEEFLNMRGKWFSVKLHVRWSNQVDSGGTEAWINGEQVANWRSQKTMASDRIYWKGGIYRSPSDTTTIMWMDDLEISAVGHPAG